MRLFKITRSGKTIYALVSRDSLTREIYALIDPHLPPETGTITTWEILTDEILISPEIKAKLS
jgi:hypothetical protein